MTQQVYFVDFGAAINFDGSIGTASAGIRLLELTAAATSTIDGSIFATTIDTSGAVASVLTFDGAGTTEQIVSGMSQIPAGVQRLSILVQPRLLYSRELLR